MEIKCNPLYLSTLAEDYKNTFLYFSQFTVYGNINLSCNNPYKFNIESAKAEPVITRCSFITTITGESLEGQRLSGKKLLINGYYKTKVIINFYDKLSAIKKIIPFSTYIVVPLELCKKNSIELEYLIEDLTTERIGKNKLLISISSLFLFSDENIYILEENKGSGG